AIGQMLGGGPAAKRRTPGRRGPPRRSCGLRRYGRSVVAATAVAGAGVVIGAVVPATAVAGARLVIGAVVAATPGTGTVIGRVVAGVAHVIVLDLVAVLGPADAAG